MVALWIQDRSHGRTKTVLVGRPRSALRRFDLVVTSAQYRLPARANIVRHTYPLLRVDEAAVAAAARRLTATPVTVAATGPLRRMEGYESIAARLR